MHANGVEFQRVGSTMPRFDPQFGVMLRRAEVFKSRRDAVCGELLILPENALKHRLENPSLNARVPLHARTVHLARPSVGNPGKARQAGRSWRSSGRIIGGQAPVARHEARAAPRSEADPMGSAGARSLCAFGVTQTPEQGGCDTEAFHAFVFPPSSGEAQISTAL